VLGAAEPRLRPLNAQLADLAEQISGTVQPDRIRADVISLSGPRNRLHYTGTDYYEELIESGFSEAGWSAERKPFVYPGTQRVLEFTSDGRHAAMADRENVQGVNVVARLGTDHPGPPVVIGAHYDTVPNSPGADDNGSGVAGLLELARVLKGLPVRVPVVLASFDQEELGMFGSRAFVEDMRAAGGTRLAVIYECIGYNANEPGAQKMPAGVGALYRQQVRKMRRRGLVGDETIVLYEGSSASAARDLGEHLGHLAGTARVVLLRNPVDLPVTGQIIRRAIPWVGEFVRSDHASFWNASLPAILLTDTANMRSPHYHAPSDKPDTLDYRRIADIVAATAMLIVRLSQEPG
jgi:Zn-dependent M28 family amino/carboxypeptidase